MKKIQIFSIIVVIALFLNVTANAEIKNNNSLLVKNNKEKRIPPGHTNYPPGLSKTPPGLDKIPPGIEKKESKPTSFLEKVTKTLLFWTD